MEDGGLHAGIIWVQFNFQGTHLRKPQIIVFRFTYQRLTDGDIPNDQRGKTRHPVYTSIGISCKADKCLFGYGGTSSSMI